MPLELTTVSSQGSTDNHPSPETIPNEPPALVIEGDVPPVAGEEQSMQFYSEPPQAPLQSQKLFDLNQLTEEEKIVLSSSGSARLYHANSQDEIDAIMQQVLDSKTTDTVLIVSPMGRQIVTCNENGDQTITRVMAADHQQSSQQQLRPGDGLGFHGESPENPQFPEPVIDYSSQHAIARAAMYGSSGSGVELTGSPSQGVIYEKHLTAEQIEMLNEQGLRKSERGMQDLYTDQSAAHEQHLVYDSNNNPHDHLEEAQLLKNGPGSEPDAEVMDGVINDKPQIDLIYGGKATVFSAPTTADGKPLGIYATGSATDLETFIGAGDHQQLVLHTDEMAFEGPSAEASTVYVVQEMVHEEAMDLQSGIR